MPDGQLVRPELRAVNVAELAQQLGAGAGFLGPFDASLEHRGQLRPPRRLPQERRERERRVVGDAEVRLDPAPRLDRVLGPMQDVGQELGEAHAVRAPALEVRRRPGPEGEHLREPLAVAHAVQQIDETVERFGVALVGLDPRLPERDRPRVLPELRREARRASDRVAPRLRLALDVRDALGHVEALFDASRRLEQRLELAGRGEHRLVRDPSAAQDRRVQRDAARRVPDPVGAQARRLHHERDLESRVLRRGRRRGEEIREAIEPSGALREVQQLRAPRLVLGRVDDREPGLLERAREVAELLVEVGDLQVTAHALLRGAHRLELDEQHAREIRVAAGRRVVVPEPRGGALAHRRRATTRAPPTCAPSSGAAPPRCAAAATTGATRAPAAPPRARARAGPTPPTRPVPPALRVLEERLDRLERGRRLAQLVEPERGHARARPARLVGSERRQPRAEERDELPVLALTLVEPLERAGELRVARLELLQLLEVPDGAVRSVREVLRGLRGVLEQRRALLARRGLERAVVEGEEIVPALGRVEDELQAIERPVRGRVELEHALEDGDDPRRVVEPLLVELHRALADGDRQLARQRAREHVGVQRGDVVGAREHARELLGAVPERAHVRQVARRARRRGERLFDASALALQVAETLEPPLTRLHLLGVRARIAASGARFVLVVVRVGPQARFALRREPRARLARAASAPR